VFSWTGFYIGAHAGAGWGTKEWSDPFFSGKVIQPIGFSSLTLANYGVNGFLGGGQIGYNWQSGWVVFGIEADGSWTNIKGTGICFFVAKNCSTKVSALGTVTGRLGGTVDRVLLYIEGGGAWVREKHTASLPVGLDGFTLSDSGNRWGWVIGGGVELAFAPNWSGKLEYNYLDFGKKTYDFTLPDGDGVSVRIRQSMHTVKVGLNYRFGWGAPIAARY
jgi:outer membrane immunogenic protein